MWRQEPTLSSSTIQLPSSASRPSRHDRSSATLLTAMCRSPVAVAMSSQWRDLPTPGVPVTMMLGLVRILAVEAEEAVGGFGNCSECRLISF
jgi:hypothetical protein